MRRKKTEPEVAGDVEETNPTADALCEVADALQFNAHEIDERDPVGAAQCEAQAATLRALAAAWRA